MERIVVIKIKLNDNKKFLIIKTRRSGQKKNIKLYVNISETKKT